jgi:predicted RND superfamily exporter protein
MDGERIRMTVFFKIVIVTLTAVYFKRRLKELKPCMPQFDHVISMNYVYVLLRILILLKE